MLCRKLNSLLHIKIPSRHIKFTKEAPVQSHYDNAKKNNALKQRNYLDDYVYYKIVRTAQETSYNNYFYK